MASAPPVPFLGSTAEIARDTWVLPAWVPLPTLGWLAANAFVIRAAQPMLVDTGLVATSDAFVDALTAIIDPRELRWIYLTHMDPDHTGSLDLLMTLAPEARVVTTFLGLGKLGLLRPCPPERFYLLNPGQSLDLGDRKVTVIPAPIFDAPETTALFDHHTRTLFSADCFGALLEKPTDVAASLAPARLEAGIVAWTRVDCPWLPWIDGGTLGRRLKTLSDLEPARVLSSHLPPAEGMFPSLARALEAARRAAPWIGPDQAAMEAAMVASQQPTAAT